jgi:hypothetical protein
VPLVPKLKYHGALRCGVKRTTKMALGSVGVAISSRRPGGIVKSCWKCRCAET